MLRGYKYRLYPTNDQKKQLDFFFGGIRFVYNLAMETKQAAYQCGVNLNFLELSRQLTELKSTAEGSFLNDIPAISLVTALRNLDRNYTKFYRGLKTGQAVGFPKYKRKKDAKQSIQMHQQYKLHLVEGYLTIPKLKNIRAIYHTRFVGTPKTITISKTNTGKYYLSVLVDTGTAAPVKKQVNESSAIGVDVGIRHLAILSSGFKFENPKHFERSLKRLKVEMRTLARRQKGSGRWHKQKHIIAALYEKITNQRQDYLHKVSHSIIKNYDTICIEDIGIGNLMVSSRGTLEHPGINVKQKAALSRGLADSSLGTFLTMLTYKAEFEGKNLIKIGRFEPSSKVCCCCGFKDKGLKLYQSCWTCQGCGTYHDRDVNAAINIKNWGLAKSLHPVT